jgi:hypothetical protein
VAPEASGSSAVTQPTLPSGFALNRLQNVHGDRNGQLADPISESEED